MAHKKVVPVSSSSVSGSGVPNINEPPPTRVSRSTRLPTPDVTVDIRPDQFGTVETGFNARMRNQHKREARETGRTVPRARRAFGGLSSTATAAGQSILAPPPPSPVQAGSNNNVNKEDSKKSDEERREAEKISPAKGQADKRKRDSVDDDEQDSDNDYLIIDGRRVKRLRNDRGARSLLRPAPIRPHDQHSLRARGRLNFSFVVAQSQQPVGCSNLRQDTTARAQEEADAMDDAYDRLAAIGAIRDPIPMAPAAVATPARGPDISIPDVDAPFRPFGITVSPAAVPASTAPARVANTTATSPAPAAAASLVSSDTTVLTRAQIREQLLLTWPRELSIPPFMMRNQESGRERTATEEERNKLRKKAGLKKTKGTVAAGLLPWWRHLEKDEEAARYMKAIRAAPEGEEQKRKKGKKKEAKEKGQDQGKKGKRKG